MTGNTSLSKDVEQLAKEGYDWWTWKSEAESIGMTTKDTKHFFMSLAIHLVGKGYSRKRKI